MYSTHNPAIADAVIASPDTLLAAATFTLLTIRQPLPTIPDMMQDVANRGEFSPYLFGMKRDGYRYVSENLERLHRTLNRIDRRHGQDSASAAVAATALFYRVPGLGAVKAGFLAQLCGYDVGCLDSHNLALYDLEPNDVNIRKTLKRRTQRSRLRQYVWTTQVHGGAQGLWDQWVNWVAGTYTGPYADQLMTGEQVSHFHYRCIVGDLAPRKPVAGEFS